MVVDEADRAGGNDLLQMQLDKLAAGQKLFRHWFRHEGEAQLTFHQREHLVGGGGLGVGPEHGVVVEEELPVEAPGHALIAERDERIAAQFLQRQAPAGQCSEGLSAHQHLIKRSQFHHLQALFYSRRGGDDGKIHFSVLHSLHCLGRGVVRDAQPDAGILGVERPQLLSQIDVQRRLRRADADGAVLEGGAGAQLFLRVLYLHRRRGDAGVEHLALRRQGDAPVGAGKEHTVQLAFQPVHRVGDVGLVVAQHPRRFRKVLILRHIIENFVVFPIDVHGSLPSFIPESHFYSSPTSATAASLTFVPVAPVMIRPSTAFSAW